MVRTSRGGLLVLALVLGLAAAAVAAPPEEEPRKGWIEVQARLEPQDLGLGQTGTLVVTSRIRDHHYVYARSGTSAVTWRRVKAKGVDYDLPAKTMTWETFQKTPGNVMWSPPKDHVDPDFPDAPAFEVWEEGHDFEIRVPITIAANASPTATIGLSIDYSPCDAEECYMRVRSQKALVKLGASPPPPKDDEAEGGADGAGPSAAWGLKPPYLEDKTARVHLRIEEGQAEGEQVAIVTFAPKEGYHLYQPESDGYPISVDPRDTPGITWKDWFYDEEGGHIDEPYEVHLPFVRDGGKVLRVLVVWQGCLDDNCEPPNEGTLEALWGAGVAPSTERPVAPPPPMVPPGPKDPADGAEEGAAPGVDVPPGEVRVLPPTETIPFPQVLGDDLAERQETVGELEARWESSWILFLGAVFLFGVGLAFTPCVLPIIPLTISVIGGGNPDVSRGRLTLLLSVYVLGLSLTYGAAGAASGALGEAIDVEAAFRIPGVIWAVTAIFLLLAAGMLGFFEMQPPAWMEKMRGGAQRRSGTIVGSFLLGILAAVIASPCTGPFVVGMLTFVAATQNPLLGFVLFFMLGLGMGAVFFAAGSLNLLVRPGVWMVWVRYAFGIILVGVALYFLANTALVPTWAIYALGFGIAFLAWLAVTRHLYRREGEALGVARKRGATLAVMIVVVTGVVVWLAHSPRLESRDWLHLAGALGIGVVVALGAWFLMTRGTSQDADEAAAKRWDRAVPRLVALISVLIVSTAAFAYFTRPVERGPEGWIKLKDVAHLQEEVAKAKEQGLPVVVDVWATWCTYCKMYDHVVEGDAHLKTAFEDMVRLKIDVEEDPRQDLRDALGLGRGQPLMAFLDKQGRIRRGLDILRWHKGDSPAELRRRVDFLFSTDP